MNRLMKLKAPKASDLENAVCKKCNCGTLVISIQKTRELWCQLCLQTMGSFCAPAVKVEEFTVYEAESNAHFQLFMEQTGYSQTLINKITFTLRPDMEVTRYYSESGLEHEYTLYN